MKNLLKFIVGQFCSTSFNCFDNLTGAKVPSHQHSRILGILYIVCNSNTVDVEQRWRDLQALWPAVLVLLLSSPKLALKFRTPAISGKMHKFLFALDISLQV